MSNSGRVKVIGYAQKQIFSDGIEYRNFSDGLVGQQYAGAKNITFTDGNFVVTSNFDTTTGKIFKSGSFSKYKTLSTLDLTNNEVLQKLVNSKELKLNTDKTKLRNYVLFGSAKEFIRTSLEHIIATWPAGLAVNQYLNDQTYDYSATTVTDYAYTLSSNTSTFKVLTNQLTNPYNILYNTEASNLNIIGENNLRNLTINYTQYQINGSSVINYTGASSGQNYLTFEVEGNPFPLALISDYTNKYHIKPLESVLEGFFEDLNEFEGYLLDRLSIPKYKSILTHTISLENGTTLTKDEVFIWPTTDGYNLDFQSGQYIQFVSGLIEIVSKQDEIESNLIFRQLTTEAITDFDSIPNSDEDSGQKINKTLKIYGREFDEITKYINGVSNAHTVSYDKKDNAPDNVIKLLGRTLGWDITSSLVNEDILVSYLNKSTPDFAGSSRGLSINEQEIEFWRRIVLNSAWIWKSKGTRKVIEMFFKLIGSPKGLFTFNEYIYKAKRPIDMDMFHAILRELDIEPDLSYLNVDSDGYPKVIRDTVNMYFQKAGLWYRQTGGDNPDADITTGNNPHVGPYDGGQAYLDQFRCLIPGFSAVTITSSVVTSGSTNLYYNDSAGDFNGVVNLETIVDVVDGNNEIITDDTCICVTPSIIQSPKPQRPTNECGCEPSYSGFGDGVLKLSIECQCVGCGMDINISSLVPSINGDCNGGASVMATSLGTIITLEYRLVGSPVWTTMTPPAQSITNLCGGDYEVRATDTSGCEEVVGFTILDEPCPSSNATVTLDDSILSNKKIIITNPDPQPGEDWDLLVTHSGGSVIVYNNTETGPGTIIVEGIEDYVHTITITDLSSCIYTYTIVVPKTTCPFDFTIRNSNDVITASLTTGSPNETYTARLFDSSNTQIGIITGPHPGTIYQFTGVAPGNYIVAITNELNCEVEHPATITNCSSLNFDTTYEDSCYGLCRGSITVSNVTGVAPFDYQLNLETPISDNNNNHTWGEVEHGAYTITIIDANGCTGVSDQITLIRKPEGASIDLQDGPMAGYSEPACEFKIDILTTPTPLLDYYYEFREDDENGTLIESGTMSSNYLGWVTTPTGTLWCRVEHSNGCCDEKTYTGVWPC